MLLWLSHISSWKDVCQLNSGWSICLTSLYGHSNGTANGLLTKSHCLLLWKQSALFHKNDPVNSQVSLSSASWWKTGSCRASDYATRPSLTQEYPASVSAPAPLPWGCWGWGVEGPEFHHLSQTCTLWTLLLEFEGQVAKKDPFHNHWIWQGLRCWRKLSPFCQQNSDTS